MSYDLAIWKRSGKTKTAMLAEVYGAICEGQTAHPAIATFNLAELEAALKVEFGDYTKEPDMFECPIHCERSQSEIGSWLIVQCQHSAAAQISPRVIQIALSRGLLVYDPQRQAVWGNKRPPKENAQLPTTEGSTDHSS